MCSQLRSCSGARVSGRAGRRGRSERDRLRVDAHLQLLECTNTRRYPSQYIVVKHHSLQLHSSTPIVYDLRDARGRQAVVAEGEYAQVRHVKDGGGQAVKLVVVQMQHLKVM